MIPRLLPLGDSAWTLEFGSAMDPAINARVMGLAERLIRTRDAEALLTGVVDVAPTFRSLTVHYDPLLTDATALVEHLLVLAEDTHQNMAAGRLWHLSVCFDTACAPDLPSLAEAKGLSADGVIERLLAATFRGLHDRLPAGFPVHGRCAPKPTHAPPGHAAPPGARAIGGPCGRNVLGLPAMLAAGDEVRWYAVDRSNLDALAADTARGLPRDTFLKAPGA